MEATKWDEKKEINVPAPVTSATLPSRDAAARPRGPGIASYLLLPLRAWVPLETISVAAGGILKGLAGS